MRERWCALAAAMVLVLQAGALGNDGYGEWEITHAYQQDRYLTSLEPLLTPLEVERIADDLTLTESQRSAFGALVEAGEREFELAWVEAAERQSDVEDAAWDDSTNWSTRRLQVHEILMAVLADRAKREASLLGDLELLLTREQQPLLVRAMRNHRRRAHLPVGTNLWGEGVDLVGVVDLLDLSEAVRQQAAPALEQYAIEMDAALTERTRASTRLSETMQDYFTVSWSRDSSPEEREEIDTRALEDALGLLRASERVRDTNARFARRIGAMIAGDAKQALEEMLVCPPREGRLVYLDARGCGSCDAPRSWARAWAGS